MSPVDAACKKLTDLGWAPHSGSQAILTMTFPDRIAKLLPTCGDTSEPAMLMFHESVASTAVRDAQFAIMGIRPLSSLVTNGDGTQVPLARATAEVLAQNSEDILDWVQGLDMNAVLAQHLATPPRESPMRATQHVCVLAVLGETARLERYRKAQAGPEPLLPPGIKQDWLEKAVRYAQSR